MNEDSAKKRSIPRKVLRISLKILAGLLVLCVLAVAGALIWLRTQSASDFISKTVTETLTAQGLELRMGPMEGALPASLHLKEISLADKDGVFFRAAGLDLETRLLALFKGRLEVADLTVKAPEVLRLPVLPPSQEPDEPEEEMAASSGGVPSLPFGVVIENLTVTKGILHAVVLSPDAPAGSVYNLDVSGAASLRGGSLAARLKLAFLDAGGMGLTFDLDLDAASGLAGLYVRDDGNQAAAEQTLADQAPAGQAVAAKGEDSLGLSIMMRENEKGLLSLLTKDPEFPPYVFTLHGRGPIRDWKAGLALLAGKDAPVAEAASLMPEKLPKQAELVALSGDIALACRSGSLWKDILEKPDFAFTLKTILAPGPKFPENLRSLTGEEIRADIGASSREEGYGVSLQANSAAWRVSLSDAYIRPMREGGQRIVWTDEQGQRREKGLAIDAVLHAAVTDMAALAGKTEKTGKAGKAVDKAASPPLQSATVTASLSALLDGAFTAVTADGLLSAGGVDTAALTGTGSQAFERVNDPTRESGNGQVENAAGEAGKGQAGGQAQEQTGNAAGKQTNGAEQQEAGGAPPALVRLVVGEDRQATTEDFSAEYSLQARLEGPRASLDSLTLNGLGIALHAEAKADTATQAVDAKAKVDLADNSRWQELLGRLSGFASKDGVAPFGGSVALALDVTLPPGQGEASAAEVSASSQEGQFSTQAAATSQQTNASLAQATVATQLTVDASTPQADTPSAQADATTQQTAGSSTPQAGISPLQASASPAQSVTLAVPRTPVSGLLRFEAVNMRWPTAQLDQIVGPSITAVARLSGGVGEGASPYVLRLEKLAAGILSAGGSLSFTPPPQAKNGAPAPVGAGMLQAALVANVSSLAPLAVDAASGKPALSGPIRAELNADGRLDALKIKVGLSSPSVIAGSAKLQDITLRVNADASLTEQAVSAAGDIAFALGQSPGGPLNLGGRWRAQVPQTAGKGAPAMSAALEAFSIRGAGLDVSADITAAMPLAVKGKIRGDVNDWNRLASLAGSPLAGGPTGFVLTLDHGGQGQEARLELTSASLRMQEKGQPPSFAVRDVKAALHASGLPDKLAVNLDLDTGRGLAGPLRWQSGKGLVKGSDNNGEFSLAMQAQRTGGARKAAAGSKKTGKRGATSSELLALRGAYDLNKMEVLLNTFVLQQPRQRVGMQLQKPLSVALANGVKVQGLDMAFRPGGKLTADADMAPGKLKVKLKLEELSFGFFKMFTQASMPDGKLTAEADLQGVGASSRGTIKVRSLVSATQDVSGVARTSGSGSIFELQVDGALSASPGESAVSGSGVRSLPGVIWLRGTGSLGDSAKQAASREGKLTFQIPLRVAPNGVPLPASGAPMAVKLDWNGPIDSLWQAVPMPDRYLSGATKLDLSVSGNMASPKLLLGAYMAGGSFQDIPNGILIRGINLEARNTPQGDVRALLSAKDEQSGNLAVEANLTGIMGGKPGTKPSLAIRGQLDQFAPMHRDDLSINLSGIFAVKGPLDALDISSDIAVTKGELVLSSKLGGSVTTLEVENKKRAGEQAEEEIVAAAGPKLNLHVAIPRYFFIRGMGVNSEWQGDLRITGNASEPSLKGSLKPVRGSVDLLSQTFAIGEGEILFTGGMDANPALDLTLMNEVPGFTAFVKVGGSAKKPKLTFESQPPLPHDEVLSMVLFGKRVSELSRFEAIQLANSLRELSGVGGSSLDVLSGARKSVGLDMLRVGGGSGNSQRGTSGQSGEGNLSAPSSASGDANEGGMPTLEAGKYINDSIYIGVEQGITQESTAVRVEVELFPSVTLQGKSTSESSEVGVGWKMDY